MKRALALASLVCAVACGSGVRVEPPPGQILLYVDTDAPLGRAGGGRASIDEPAPLFDRLRIEVYGPNETAPCDGCVNEFAIDADAMRALTVSVGVAPTPGVSGFRARVRMFLAAHAKAGEPDPDGTIESNVALPAVDATGTSIVTVNLMTDDVGAPKGTLDVPIDPTDGPPDSSKVGTWPRAARTPCAGQPGPGEVCVPGGAFWMGGRRGVWSFLPGHDTLPPRLVVLAPFYLDAHEVTVGDYRPQYSFGSASLWSGSSDGSSLYDFCTYTAAPQGREDLPINCLPWRSASEYCAALGKELPTEAQHEYASSALVGSLFVWGEDLPSCEDAVFSRLGWGIFSGATSFCMPSVAPGGALPIGSGKRDRLELPTGTVVDLIGNVSEWLQDKWAHSDEPCWKRPGVYVDPVCMTASTVAGETSSRSARGGDWLVPAGQLAHTVRVSAPDIATFYSPELGFRCMRPGR